jgi:hypothetical protein
MIRRNAVSLVEVLAALFIVGIGMISLMTLFPLGALTMAQAIKDGRAAQHSANAAAMAELFHYALRTDQGRSPQPIYTAMSAGLTGAKTDYPSYPVYCDPIGYVSMSANRAKLGGTIPRVSPSFISQSANMNQDIARLFMSLDDMNFNDNGVPATPYGKVQRQGAFSWAFMLQRPRLVDASVTNLTVVVYEGRGLALTGNVLDGTEPVFSASGSPGTNTITVSTGKPPVRRGSWILDNSTSPAGDQQMYGPVHAFFYRVAGVLESSGSVTLEVETPLRAPISQITVMTNAVEVFEKGPGRLP